MDLKIEEVKSLSAVKELWKKLYAVTPEVSPFLDYDAMTIAWQYFYPYYITRRCRPVLILFKEGKQIRAIAPMLRYRSGKLQLFGFANGFNESGLLYDSLQTLENVMRLLKESNHEVEFLKIDARSPIAKFLPESARPTVNVEIELPSSYDEYFSSLSKSTRQNIRTAYNRLNKDGLSLELNLYKGDDSLPVDEILRIYCTRHNSKYGVTTSRVKMWFLKHQSFATRYYRFATNTMNFVLYINGKPAAFLSGLSNYKRLTVPRLSIDETFRKYSPGVLLIVETIKYLINNTPIRTLDLSQGQESYKYQLGGKEHLSFSAHLAYD